MAWKHTQTADADATAVHYLHDLCRSCAAAGGAHSLHCRTLRLAPGWYERLLAAREQEAEDEDTWTWTDVHRALQAMRTPPPRRSPDRT
jgi:hypothetical protein